ncbi:NUDIX hydrolase [Nocardia farcinica]|uniref:NUDIX domain n=3 Tax=Nocardiaceae TaxID=85025 RepID=A0A0H5P8B3_NOCFR|nr:NUDIX hydrolase [Nocardia farcinica]PEH77114.1 NUDIX hydrolase [Nocardia sp. FDAARGOS_372]MBA4858639.1 NUDIX hydrolase [Nocardia farcinica]MBC9815200.1 NUDIX hydrolase [Nocardia farcinica]MBF6072330.1 NUDIX hydrolase [Nocardia farcinica]
MSETNSAGAPASQAPQPKDASTVMLVRDSARGPEVFLQRRVGGMAFAAGMTVFPGGGVDPSDATADIAWAGPEPAWWARRFDTTEPRVKALVCAAVRETFEECGVLLAGPTADTVVGDTAAYREARGKLERRELSLAAFLAEEKLVLRADLLRPWANWITPVIEPRRYDTRFFVAVLPSGQRADGATSEAAEVHWRTPAEELDRWREGVDILLPPTWAQLDALAAFDSTAEILAAEPVIEPIMPVLAPAGGAQKLTFPDGARYFADLPEAGKLRGSARS